MKKFALVSTALPPSQSGQSVVLFHLLKNIEPRNYCLITQKNFHLYSVKPRCSLDLPAKYYFLRPDYQVIRLFTRIAVICRFPALIRWVLMARVRQLKKIIRTEQCGTVIACTGDLLDPPAAFIASKDLGLPFVLYTFDYYSFQGTGPVLSSFVNSFESDLVQKAVHVIVPNECMYKEYKERYGVSSVVIHNPLDLSEYENMVPYRKGRNAESPGGKKILYTGAIYDAHYGAFRTLLKALSLSGRCDITVHLYTPQSLHHMRENGITGPLVVVHKAQSAASMPAIQHDADILFLPLSFDNDLREMVKTSAPAKIGEYLASKKPVLVHAPRDSFVAWYFKKYRCGLVVDDDSPEILAQAIHRLLTDENFCQEITQNAYERVKADFDVNAARKNLLGLI